MHSRDWRLHASEPDLKGDERGLNATGSGLNEREPELHGVESGWTGDDAGESRGAEVVWGSGAKLSERRCPGKKNLLAAALRSLTAEIVQPL